MNDWLELIGSIIGIIIAVICFNILAESCSCSSKAEAQGLPYSYGPIKGCMVEVDGKWVDYDRLRIER